ncbi:hypothetical protein Dda_0913 [Drechslerella dactyloides]|uniref:Nucleoside phosphorylase domain-containing protein n=1 Tax=Drechslerella dactyloides TaxID=74499 RepID=A0AAD6NMG9_DREDA|nr:hypothetical protein Dda_0913 [Drechslerella dactyloides]
MSNPTSYTVGWICALKEEFVAAISFLDERHADLEEIAAGDSNSYQLGRMHDHNVVIALFPKGGKGLSLATAVIKDMLRSFDNIRICLMVGIGGGVPTLHDIRLGDIVVSTPGKKHGGVLQYDVGSKRQGQDLEWDGYLDQPLLLLRSTAAKLEGLYDIDGHQLEKMVENSILRHPNLVSYGRPDPESDRLYIPKFTHKSDVPGSCSIICGSDQTAMVSRPERNAHNVHVHYGLIASGNQVIRDAIFRDRLGGEKDVLCFEMEAAGLMEQFPCLIIRGISDYCDSHKNDTWKKYAAMTAAAYARDLLRNIPPTKVENQVKLTEILGILSSR